MMSVSFYFNKNPQSTLNITYESHDRYAKFKKQIYFHIPYGFFISIGSLVALIIVCRPKNFKQLYFPYAITKFIADCLLKDYNIEIIAPIVNSNNIVGLNIQNISLERSGHYLQFSGGVDSLAANYLWPKYTGRISLDFGDRFARESQFFSKWNTICVNTDFRNKPFDEKIDWRFMAAGSILFSDYLGIEVVYFGTIMEASPYWFQSCDRGTFENRENYQAFRMAGIKQAFPVAALSEYGTTLLASKYGLDVLKESIKSAADSGTSKLFRKKLLKKIIYNEKITKDWAERNKPNSIEVSGKSFAEDILAIYFAKKIGIEFVENYIMLMNEQYRKIIKEVNMDFFEKYNINNLRYGVPETIRSEVESTYINVGLTSYNDNDDFSLNQLRKHFSNIYDF